MDIMDQQGESSSFLSRLFSPFVKHKAQRPANDNRDGWKTYWTERGQPWRTEPEIDKERQKYLAQRRVIAPNIQQGIYPFKGIKLDRADVEWLLATHENGRGPVDWSDESQRRREGLDLRGADLCQVDLSNLPLANLCGGVPLEKMGQTPIELQNLAVILMRGTILEKTHLEGAILSRARLEKAKLFKAHLEEAFLRGAYLKKAILIETHLERADLVGTHLQGADMIMAHLERADLGGAHLEGAGLTAAHLEGANLLFAYLDGTKLIMTHLEKVDLREAHLTEVSLERAKLADEKQVGPRLADVHWSNTNLAIVDWTQVKILGDEYEAQQKVYVGQYRMGEMKSRAARLDEYQVAVRANRQLAVALQAQGLNEDAARFSYRAQILQWHVSWFQILQPEVTLRSRIKAFGALLFSWFLFLVAGYGYRLWHSLATYVVVNAIFAFFYWWFDPCLSWLAAVVVSMLAFHGRGFASSTFSPGDPTTIVSAIEAFVGLVIEVTLIATLTRRFFSR
jgi:uncharacterized protein YjbI with pentapeptide repeats